MNPISWLNRKLAGKPVDDPATIRAKLRDRCNAEITARILRRAEIHDGQNSYLARCSPLDREAAARITALERELALLKRGDANAFHRDVERMLAILREP
jgi:hypothetical protein